MNLSPQLQADLLELLNYAQPDEEDDYEENQEEAGDAHIVFPIRRLRAAMTPALCASCGAADPWVSASGRCNECGDVFLNEEAPT